MKLKNYQRGFIILPAGIGITIPPGAGGGGGGPPPEDFIFYDNFNRIGDLVGSYPQVGNIWEVSFDASPVCNGSEVVAGSSGSQEVFQNSTSIGNFSLLDTFEFSANSATLHQVNPDFTAIGISVVTDPFYEDPNTYDAGCSIYYSYDAMAETGEVIFEVFYSNNSAEEYEYQTFPVSSEVITEDFSKDIKLTFDGTSFRWYLDDSLIHTYTPTNPIDSSDPLHVQLGGNGGSSLNELTVRPL